MTEQQKTCAHAKAKRGPGSAYAWLWCADCGLSLGCTIPYEKCRVGDLAGQREAIEWKFHESRGCIILEDPRDHGRI